MATHTLSVVGVSQSGGKARVRFSDKVELEFSSLAEARQLVAQVVTKETARALAIARYLAVDPNGSNPSIIVGHSITLTDSANQMVVVS